ncbi:MAG: hypothetical protein PF436_07640 [Prolixibacteraceae bacterium]|jgi:predicted type IV restriction endonuclease|nr:hypothetical protein [Prolixibacteraceae bacterium]
MNEIIFVVTESDEGGYEAQALGHSIFTEADSVEELKDNIREAIQCHFDENAPKLVRLHFIKEEIFAA